MLILRGDFSLNYSSSRFTKRLRSHSNQKSASSAYVIAA